MLERADQGLLRDLYPGTDSCVYLDVAAVGLISSSVQGAMSGVATDHEQRGMAAFEGWAQAVNRTRAKIGQLVGGGADRVAFTQNTCRRGG